MNRETVNTIVGTACEIHRLFEQLKVVRLIPGEKSAELEMELVDQMGTLLRNAKDEIYNVARGVGIGGAK